MIFSPKTARTRNTHKKTCSVDRKKQEGQQRHQYEVANKYVFKCRLKVDSDDDHVTNDGRLFHARAAATGKARSPIVLRRVTGTTTAVDELERRLRLVPTSAARCHHRHLLREEKHYNNESSDHNDESLRGHCTNERRIRKRDKRVRNVI